LKSTRKPGPGRAASSQRTQFNQSQHGGRRAGSGAPAGNGNAKKALAWLDSFDLTNPEGVQAFLKQVIKETWCGRLGSRACGALNGTLRLLLEHMLLPELEERIARLEGKEAKN